MPMLIPHTESENAESLNLDLSRCRPGGVSRSAENGVLLHPVSDVAICQP